MTKETLILDRMEGIELNGKPLYALYERKEGVRTTVDVGRSKRLLKIAYSGRKIIDVEEDNEAYNNDVILRSMIKHSLEELR